MLELTVSLASPPDDAILGDSFDILWNVNSAGIASGSVTTAPVNGRPIPLFKQPDSLWGVTPWGNGGWCGWMLANETFTTPTVHFGLVKIALKSRDSLGNYQDGAAAETELTVNTTPRLPTQFERGSWSSPQQSFTFVESAQLEV